MRYMRYMLMHTQSRCRSCWALVSGGEEERSVSEDVRQPPQLDTHLFSLT